MSHRTVEITTQIDNTPEAVIGFISDVRNRTRYVPSLTTAADVQGDAAGSGQSWKWQFDVFGMTFHGMGHSTHYEAGRSYGFRTEGELESAWEYRAEPEGENTRLSLRVEYTVPENILPKLPPHADLKALEDAEAARVFANLQEVLRKR